MTRDEKTGLVEALLEMLVENDLSRLPVHPAVAVETPMTPRVSGPEAMRYLKGVASGLQGVRIIQHIVEGEYVATVLEEDTTAGKLVVCGRFRIESGRITDIRVFYDPRIFLAAAAR